jgi:hypothetical protein
MKQVIADDSPVWKSWSLLRFGAHLPSVPVMTDMTEKAYHWILDIDRSLWIQENPVNAYEPMVWATDLELLQRAL